jgi:YtcA family
VYPFPVMRITLRGVAAAALIAAAAGCDPILNIEGSFFPAWMASMVIGLALTAASRYLFAVTRLEPHLGPPLLIYSSLALLLTAATWLVLYRS